MRFVRSMIGMSSSTGHFAHAQWSTPNRGADSRYSNRRPQSAHCIHDSNGSLDPHLPRRLQVDKGGHLADRADQPTDVPSNRSNSHPDICAKDVQARSRPGRGVGPKVYVCQRTNVVALGQPTRAVKTLLLRGWCYGAEFLGIAGRRWRKNRQGLPPSTRIQAPHRQPRSNHAS